MPVVLRKHNTTSGGEYFEFIGECYLHTMMDSRAIDIQENEGIKTVLFELR